MEDLVNLDLFGGSPHPCRSGRINREKAEAKEEDRREKACHNMFRNALQPICGTCKRPMVVTPSWYLVCLKCSSKLIDPRDYVNISSMSEEHEDENELPIGGD
jgi:hypothetical protein